MIRGIPYLTNGVSKKAKKAYLTTFPEFFTLNY